MFVATQPRRPLDSFSGPTPTPCPPLVLSVAEGSPNSHGIISFTDPHPLNSFVSYRYKNIRGREVPPTFLSKNAPKPVVHRSFFSTTYKLQISQLLSFDIHAKCRGCMGAFLPLPTTQCPLPTIPCLFKLLPTLLRFFALTQNSTLLFSDDSALFAKNTRGWGTPLHRNSRQANLPCRQWESAESHCSP